MGGRENTIPAVERPVAILKSSRRERRWDDAGGTCVVPGDCAEQLLPDIADAAGGGVDPQDGGDALRSLVRSARDGAETDRWLRRVSARCCRCSEELAQATGLCCKLSVRQGEFQIPLLRAASPRADGGFRADRGAFPCGGGSVGAALLSTTPAAEREKLARICARESGVAESPELLRRRRRGDPAGRLLLQPRPEPLAGRRRCPRRSGINRGRAVAALTLLGYDEDFSEERLPSVARELLNKAEQCGRIYARA